jgi:hypothetical protein
MPRLTIKLDDRTLAMAKRMSEEAGVSLEKWVVALIQDHIAEERREVFRSLAGCWPDAPDPAELRHVAAEDCPREPL